ncbi:MAG TPA: GNAT family N-acetyltransferase [Solirubrobacteraceae bacterium]|nr:GNAT family N-acetyltransferase [Solirubrobacteraceae bacterium]
MLKTERLLLRRWRETDRAPFAALNADPEVMRWFPAPLSRQASDELAAAADAHIAREGWGLWALEERTTGRFLGFTGLARPSFDAPFMPAVEIGWRLARTAWGRGLASEAAHAAASFAFHELGVDEIVSFTVAGNARSRAVMRRIGMRHDVDGDFDHPSVSAGELRRHVLYRLTQGRYEQRLNFLTANADNSPEACPPGAVMSDDVR